MSNYHDEDGDFDQYVEYGEGFNIILICNYINEQKSL
ncbi:GTP-binding protein EngA [Nodularia spumigena CCY9414]|jgi:hypothetical protein|nr:GTP-binding protein EngA [Nodularia spumigena CCY9414]